MTKRSDFPVSWGGLPKCEVTPPNLHCRAWAQSVAPGPQGVGDGRERSIHLLNFEIKALGFLEPWNNKSGGHQGFKTVRFQELNNSDVQGSEESQISMGVLAGVKYQGWRFQ
jgi:hypothetical protein